MKRDHVVGRHVMSCQVENGTASIIFSGANISDKYT